MKLINANEFKKNEYNSEQWHKSAVPTIKCKDCVFRNEQEYCPIARTWVYDNFYCANSERKYKEQNAYK